MDDKRKRLLMSTKKAVANYGLYGATTRNIAEAAGMNDGNIYRFFETKEELILRAYELEIGTIIDNLQRFLDEPSGLPIDMRTKTRIVFHRFWQDLLSDSERLMFCYYYYHSALFKDATAIHQEELEGLLNRLSRLFENRNKCRRVLYAFFGVSMDFSVKVVRGEEQNTREYEEEIFSLFYSILDSQMRSEYTERSGTV